MEQKIYQYRIVTKDNGYFIAEIWNDKAKHSWKGLIHNYRFTSAESRQNWINGFIRNVESHERIKRERKDARKNVVNTFKVGDILYNSWGYEQTNVDFYQVLESKGKTVKIREIKGRMTERGTGNSMAGYTTAIKDQFVKDTPVITKRVTREDSIHFNSYSSLIRWDGEELYCSCYG